MKVYFKSKSKNLVIPYKKKKVEVVGDETVVVQEASFFKFTNGVYVTEDKKEIEFLKKHIGLGNRFIMETEEDREKVKAKLEIQKEIDEMLKSKTPEEVQALLTKGGGSTDTDKEKEKLLKEKEKELKAKEKEIEKMKKELEKVKALQEQAKPAPDAK